MSDVVLPTHPLFINRTGHQYGRWIVVGYAGRRGKESLWLCRCYCGKESSVQGGHLANGRTQSCGCLQRELISARSTKHGSARTGKKTSEYLAWEHMMTRCFNAEHEYYHNYGGRGIIVCDRWRDFANFLADMGQKPTPNHTIDRFPNKDGNYEPCNCRWATMKEQQRNRRNNVMLTYNGETMCVSEWSERTDIKHGTIGWRIRRGWTAERSLTTV